MANSLKNLYNEASSTSTSRPQSGNSRHRLAAQAAGDGVTLYSNNLFDGDVLAGESEYSVPGRRLTPSAPRTASPAGSQKIQQQRALAAQKRMERLQMGGVAQTNDSIAVVSVNSRPGTPSKQQTGAGAATSGFGSPGSPMFGSFNSNTAAQTCSLPDAPATGGQEAWTGSGLRPSSAAEKNLLAKGLATAYDPSEDPEVEEQQQMMVRPTQASGGKSGGLIAGIPTNKLDLSDMTAFLLRPGSKAGPVNSYISREKGGMGKSPCYRMYLDDGNVFLLAARKRKKSTSSAYVISSSKDPDDLTRKSSSYIGKLRSNFVGTEFSVYSRPSSANSAATAAAGSNVVAAASSPMSRQYRSTGGSSRSSRGTEDDVGGTGGKVYMQEVGAIQFAFNVLGTRGPRQMTVGVPALGTDGAPRWRPSGPDDHLLERLKSSNTTDIAVLQNEVPKWNDAMNAYCLNFNGRVTEASVKNFQLVTDTDNNTVVLQFGKISDTCFTCDYMWPLTPLQAFCICLASFDNKLACE